MRDLRYKYHASAWFVDPTTRIVPGLPGKYKHHSVPVLPPAGVVRRSLRERRCRRTASLSFRATSFAVDLAHLPAGSFDAHANSVRRGPGWVAHGFSRGGRDHGWNPCPDRLGAVAHGVPGGVAARVHSVG
jgi:hypothetical protein